MTDLIRADGSIDWAENRRLWDEDMEEIAAEFTKECEALGLTFAEGYNLMMQRQWEADAWKFERLHKETP